MKCTIRSNLRKVIEGSVRKTPRAKNVHGNWKEYFGLWFKLNSILFNAVAYSTDGVNSQLSLHSFALPDVEILDPINEVTKRGKPPEQQWNKRTRGEGNMISNRPQVAQQPRILPLCLHEMNTQYGFRVLPAAHTLRPIASVRSEFYVFVTQCFPNLSPWRNFKIIIFSHFEEPHTYKNAKKETFDSAWNYCSISYLLVFIFSTCFILVCLLCIVASFKLSCV